MVWSCQASQHDADHCKSDIADDGSCIALVVARQPPIAADPGEGALHNPAFWQDDEFVQLVAFDDLDNPIAGACGGQGGACALIAGIGEDAQDEGKQCPRARIENESRAIAILDVCRMNGNAQQEAKRVDKDVPLAARDFLARIVALCIDKSPPLSAALALWLSMIAAVGLGSRPTCSRVST